MNYIQQQINTLDSLETYSAYVLELPNDDNHYHTVLDLVEVLNKRYANQHKRIVVVRAGDQREFAGNCQELQNEFRHDGRTESDLVTMLANSLGQSNRTMKLPFKFPIYYSVMKENHWAKYSAIWSQTVDNCDNVEFIQMPFAPEAITRYGSLDAVPAGVWDRIVPILDIESEFAILARWRYWEYGTRSEAFIAAWEKMITRLGHRINNLYAKYIAIYDKVKLVPFEFHFATQGEINAACVYRNPELIKFLKY